MATAATAVVCGVFAHDALAASACAVLGGLSAALPSLAFALRLSILMQRTGQVDPIRFLTGELIKVVSTVVLLCGAVALARWGGWLGDWWALLVGFVVALKTYLVVLLVAPRSRRRMTRG